MEHLLQVQGALFDPVADAAQCEVKSRIAGMPLCLRFVIPDQPGEGKGNGKRQGR